MILGRWKNWLKSREPQSGARVSDGVPGTFVDSGRCASISALYLDALLPVAGAPSLSLPEKLVAQVVERQLSDESQRVTAVPRAPSVMPLLLRHLRDPLASSRDYAAIILQDPLIATALLRMASSVYFNPYRKTLDNFEAVVSALGVVKLRLILSAVVLQPMLRGGGEMLPQRVWNHSLACASCCQQLAGEEGIDGYNAYLTGLVHDIGVVTICHQVQLLGREYLGAAPPSPLLLRQLVVAWARPLATWIAADWQLPGEVVDALAGQHEAGRGGALASILQRANGCCEALALCRDGLLDRTEVEQLAAALGIAPRLLALLDEGYGGT